MDDIESNERYQFSSLPEYPAASNDKLRLWLDFRDIRPTTTPGKATWGWRRHSVAEPTNPSFNGASAYGIEPYTIPTHNTRNGGVLLPQPTKHLSSETIPDVNINFAFSEPTPVSRRLNEHYGFRDTPAQKAYTIMIVTTLVTPTATTGIRHNQLIMSDYHVNFGWQNNRIPYRLGFWSTGFQSADTERNFVTIPDS